ncbi:MAG: biotin synthase BioB [Gloeomargaritaceae cyanobacterium C42_A2020_066]|nr:biotin synthase BioB [Gloeomargaritaceae cyanobacterium C42_A2020_066]
MPPTLDTITDLYQQPLADLILQAQAALRQYHDPRQVQLCTLGNIKTGGCPEDCGYCAQSVHHATALKPEPLMAVSDVVAAAQAAQAAGATRFCMGAAWREVKDGPQFERVLEMVSQVAALGVEVCCTLGMLQPHQAQRLKAAGLTAYNHNLDTSPEYYGEVIQTRAYADRLETLATVAEAGLSVCCGGIVGMGETVADRLRLLEVLGQLPTPPESIPVNCLVPIAGTPLAGAEPIPPLELIRLIATTRILFPRARVRLAAGRLQMSPELQALCFLAGANSIFAGSKLLTTPNPDQDEDLALLMALGLTPRPAAVAPTV